MPPSYPFKSRFFAVWWEQKGTEMLLNFFLTCKKFAKNEDLSDLSFKNKTSTNNPTSKIQIAPFNTGIYFTLFRLIWFEILFLRSIPVMNDKFLYTFLYLAINLISFLACASRMLLPGRPILNQVSFYSFFTEKLFEFWHFLMWGCQGCSR